MKNYIVAVLLSLCVVATAFARPALIGHRGSYWGVENSAEAFIAGAEAGYQYLETDVKVAGDGTFILIHDDDTERLGGNLDILSATIDELKAETYTQTRGGVTYTGKICTLEEYLQPFYLLHPQEFVFGSLRLLATYPFLQTYHCLHS